jgi:hypothetical protein
LGCSWKQFKVAASGLSCKECRLRCSLEAAAASDPSAKNGSKQFFEVYFIHKGEIWEQGTHEALLARDGLYSRLYELRIGSGTEIATAQPTLRRLSPSRRRRHESLPF